MDQERGALMRPTMSVEVPWGRLLLPAVIAAGLIACAAPVPRPAPQEGAPGYPSPGTPAPPPAQPAPPERPGTPPPKQFRLGTAASALIARAHDQAHAGDYAGAGITLERALRIEPDNPLVWIEYGRVELDSGDAVQADAMGRKALQLATGDPSALSGAWHLVADSLRALGNNQLAAEADRSAAALSPH
jgi:Tfp pilus assembly protein PilF